jgi:hypothetical protein
LPAQPALARCASPNTPDGLLTKDLELALMRKKFVALLALCLRLSPRQTEHALKFLLMLWTNEGSVSRKRIKTAKPVVPVQPDPPI